VAVIDEGTQKLLTTIPVGENTSGMVVSPDQSTLYVSNSDSSSISVIDTATNTVSHTIDIPTDEGEAPFRPGPLAISSDGATLYASLDYPDGCPFESSVATIDTATSEILSSDVALGEATFSGLALAFGGLYGAAQGGCSDYYYFAALQVGIGGSFAPSLSLLQRDSVVLTGDLAIPPDSHWAYVAVTNENSVHVVDLWALRRFEVETTTFAVGESPTGLALNGAGTTLFVANRCGSSAACTSGSLQFVDTGTGAVTDEFPLSGNAAGVAVSPVSTRVYVAAGNLAVISQSFRRLVGTIPLAEAGRRVAFAFLPTPNPFPSQTPTSTATALPSASPSATAATESPTPTAGLSNGSGGCTASGSGSSGPLATVLALPFWRRRGRRTTA
jgi:YVTN family beta-propeller protein